MARRRYCGPCDTWVTGAECPSCGADTDAPARAARADGRVDCPACGHHGSQCQEDLDSGATICHTTGVVVAWWRLRPGSGEATAAALAARRAAGLAELQRAASLADPDTQAALALTDDEVNDLVAGAES